MTDLRTWDAWRDVHQPFELEWWKTHLHAGHSYDDAAFAMEWNPVRDFIKPYGQIIDIGCGPRPPFKPCVAIEPLADEYRKLVPFRWWWDVQVVAQPAEDRIDGLRGDTIICWNCLDHTIGWKKILDNMLAYGNEDARFAIATDFFPPFVGHPGFERDDFMVEIKQRFVILEQREPFGRQLALLMRKKW